MPAAVAKSSNKVMKPVKLSGVTDCSGPSETSLVMRSKDSLDASGCDKVDRSKVKTRFHSVCDLKNSENNQRQFVLDEPYNFSVLLHYEDDACNHLLCYQIRN
jgi:hypothetical protein